MSRTMTAVGSNFPASGFHYDPREEVMIYNATIPPHLRSPVNRVRGTPGRFHGDQIQPRDPAAARRRTRDSDVVFTSPAAENLGYHYRLQQRLRQLGFPEERRIIVEHDPEEESILIFDALSERGSNEVGPDLAADQCFRTTPASDSAIDGLERVETGSVTEDCTICLEAMVGSSDGGTQRLIRMPCEHLFHESCAVSWLKTSHFCPLCRFQIPADA